MSEVPRDGNDDIARLVQGMSKKTGLSFQGEIAEEMYDLFELVPCFITVQDRNFKLLKFNREFQEKFNPEPGAYCYNAYKGRDEKCVDCPVEKTFEDGLLHWSEEEGFNKEGSPAQWVVKAVPIRDSKGEVVAAMEMCLDITRVKQLERKLESTEKKYQAIFNNIPNPVFVLEKETYRILDCNQSVEEVYGYARPEALGKSFLDFFRPEDKAHYESRLNGTTVIDQARHLTKDGRRLFVKIRVALSEFQGRKVLIVTTSDITKRLETERQLIQASKMATLGEMATGIAHELNQPLSVIRTAGSLIMRKAKKNEKVDDEVFLTVANKITSNVDRATKIINHLREFGRKSDLKREKVQVNDVLKRTLDLMGHQLKLRDIRVFTNFEENLPPVYNDPILLEQVFINLLMNARDAIEEKLKGSQARGEESITISTSSLGGMVNIAVADTGCGVAENLMDRIFEPFFTTKEPGKGTGLGLSITYGIIKDCGGSIKVISTEGSGATFVVKLPAAERNG